jgi:hypothetical protein
MFCSVVAGYEAFQAVLVYVQLDQCHFVFVILIQLLWHELQLKKLQGRDQYQYHGDEVLTFHLYPDVSQQRT